MNHFAHTAALLSALVFSACGPTEQETDGAPDETPEEPEADTPPESATPGELPDDYVPVEDTWYPKWLTCRAHLMDKGLSQEDAQKVCAYCAAFVVDCMGNDDCEGGDSCSEGAYCLVDNYREIGLAALGPNCPARPEEERACIAYLTVDSESESESDELTLDQDTATYVCERCTVAIGDCSASLDSLDCYWAHLVETEDGVPVSCLDGSLCLIDALLELEHPDVEKALCPL